MLKNTGIGSRVRHPTYGEGVIYKQDLVSWFVMFPAKGGVEMSRDTDKLELVEAVNQDESYITREYLETIIRQSIEEYTDLTETVQLGGRWIKGKMVLHSSDEGTKAKEIPMEIFFHKIVMLRDRLRVLEQRINAHKLLTEEDKIEMQQYITRCYGSLTTFNFLFSDKSSWFAGDSEK